MTVKTYHKNLAAAALGALLLTLPLGATAAETAALVPGSQIVQQAAQKLPAFAKLKAYRGVSVSQAWLRQARRGGLSINLRLHTPMGEEVTFREHLKAAASDADTMCLYLQASVSADVITLQLDQPAVDTLRRLGISEVVVADAERCVRARYMVGELEAVRDVLGLAPAEQLCVSGEDAPVTVVNEDGVRRQVNP